MKPKLIFFIVALFIVSAVVMYKIDRRNEALDGEVSEIKRVLEVVSHSEVAYFKEHGLYSSDLGVFGFIHTKHPVLVGLLPDCSATSSGMAHAFLGPRDPAFEKLARLAMSHEMIKGKCHSLREGFVAFSAQNLDEDDDLELWSVDQENQFTVLVED